MKYSTSSQEKKKKEGKTYVKQSEYNETKGKKTI